LAFPPDGKTVAVARDESVVRLRDLTTDRWLIDLHHSLPTFGQILAFSPDGKTLVVAGVWDVATVWDTASGRMTGFLEGHARYLKSVAYSPDGKTIATGAHDNTLKLWDAPAPPSPERAAVPRP
jgi:WD40 repeat protein